LRARLLRRASGRGARGAPSGLMRGRPSRKLILCGEHAVVHGYPAVALAVDRGTTVRLVRPEAARRPDDPRLRAALALLLPAGWDVAIDSELPIGCGMGSSAAIAVATVRAVA